ncbi:hypothetical protein [Chryseobacterium jejuense]|uniref:hypothetical protein n=1 Tax=Chryseobacterium jejuense TaxID=445960 RepID=UPI001AE7CDFD|nr:hypothetical protein [Chryseobacterium jejuense]MBP2616431.1 hypothetical protein [Chryseobacterium jejuense]
MEIEILTYLKDNPAAYPGNKEYEGRIQPISFSEIQNHEMLYNNGNPFPKVLRELLLLAGKYCYVLEHNILEINEFQEEPREWMEENNKAINHPFYVIEICDFAESFLFVHLDEDDDPIVRHAELYCKEYNVSFISCLCRLSAFINHRIDMKKKYRDPF